MAGDQGFLGPNMLYSHTLLIDSQLWGFGVIFRGLSLKNIANMFLRSQIIVLSEEIGDPSLAEQDLKASRGIFAQSSS